VPIHHLNCATMRPPLTPPLVAHVLLVERAEGLLLVDTGFGTQDLADPRRLGAAFRVATRAALDPAETALAQVQRLGHRPEDVTDIALTHLDLDHAGGLGDFPNARVHVHATELAAAQAPTVREKARYIAAQWAHGPRWTEHTEGGDTWFGFPSATVLADDVVLIPLPGHTRGHSGIGVRRDDGSWLLHAGDAFFSGGQLDTPATCPRSLAAFQVLMAVDNDRRRANLERLRELAQGHPEVTVICAHDKATFDRFAG
jgi:glyoxylase-like metal-dependent hydrolase (beta-lactamase superfamily II)